jgi:WD40 repeat protein
MTWSPDEEMLVTHSTQGIDIWAAGTGKHLRNLTNLAVTDTSDYRRVEWSPDSRLLVTAVYGDSALSVWDVASGRRVQVIPGCVGIGEILFVRNQSKRLLYHAAMGIILWDLQTGLEVHSLVGTNVKSVMWSPTGELLATLSSSVDGCTSVVIWDSVTGRPIRALAGMERLAQIRWSDIEAPTVESESPDRRQDESSGSFLGTGDTVLSPDGSMIAYQSNLGTVTIEDAESQVQIRRFSAQKADSLHSVLKWSANSRCLAASSESVIQIWDVVTGEMVLWRSDLGFIDGLVFNPGGDRLAATINGMVMILDVSCM